MNVQEKTDQFINKCRSKGLSVTPQRLAIYKSLLDDETHPNPESVFNKIKGENPTISFATVYKTLETFQKHGIISLVTNLHNTVRYDPITDPHHHAVCVKCKKVIDVFDDRLNELPAPPSILSNNILLNHSVQFNVVCADCREE